MRIEYDRPRPQTDPAPPPVRCHVVQAELAALSVVLQRPICVHVLEGGNELPGRLIQRYGPMDTAARSGAPTDAAAAGALHVLYTGGNHYSALLLKASPAAGAAALEDAWNGGAPPLPNARL